jgi:hypothetical protein
MEPLEAKVNGRLVQRLICYIALWFRQLKPSVARPVRQCHHRTCSQTVAFVLYCVLLLLLLLPRCCRRC